MADGTFSRRPTQMPRKSVTGARGDQVHHQRDS